MSVIEESPSAGISMMQMLSFSAMSLKSFQWESSWIMVPAKTVPMNAKITKIANEIFSIGFFTKIS